MMQTSTLYPYPLDCFFLQDFPENVWGDVSRKLHKLFRGLGLKQGKICYQLIGNRAEVHYQGQVIWVDIEKWQVLSIKPMKPHKGRKNNAVEL